VLNLMSEITLRMIEGELLETHTTGRLDLTEAEYLDMVFRKTACLFSGCTETAALLVDREEWRQPLRTYGEAIGVAYQLVDDLLDFTGAPEVLGKPVASDLREGKLTLPVIDLLARRPALESTVSRIVESPDESDEAYACLVSGLHEEGSLSRARSRAMLEAERAREAVSALPESVYREALDSLPDLLVTRQS
jgi:octaprenyl-diphosphate synthase